MNKRRKRKAKSYRRLNKFRLVREDGVDTYELNDQAKGLMNLWSLEPTNEEVMNPPELKRIPKDGAWAMIIRKLPAIERGMSERVRVGRVFYIEHEEEADDFGFLSNGTYKMRCRTPWGDVCLWPYEYSVVDTATILFLWDSKEIVFHPQVENVRFNDALFYIRSRGIALVDAMVMVLGTLKGNVGWFEPAPGLAEECEAMEEHVHRWKPRRKSKKRMKVVVSVVNGEGYESTE